MTLGSITAALDDFSNYVIYFCWLVKVLPLERALRTYEILDTKYIFFGVCSHTIDFP